MMRPTALICLILSILSTACDVGGSTNVSVLASSELKDMAPLLGQIEHDTGVRLRLDYRGTLEAGDALKPGGYRYDLAWLSSDRYFRLQLRASGRSAQIPPRQSTMLSPVVIGLTPQAAVRLRRMAGHAELTWADLADGAARGLVRFGMADPHTANTGLSALVGVATAASGGPGPLRLQDVTCDRLQGLFSGHVLAATTSEELITRFVADQDRLDGMINYESSLLTLNASGRLRRPLELIYPQDGIVMSEYPLLLLRSRAQGAYDKILEWFKNPRNQQRVMQATLRRPYDPDIPRDPRLSSSVGNALDFPADKRVIDRLLANYADPRTRVPDEVRFLLDFSPSMNGARSAALKRAFSGLGGDDDSSLGRFVRFYRGERVTLVRFAGQVLAEKTFTVGQPGEMQRLRDFVASDRFGVGTAIWSTLDHAYRGAARIVGQDPGRKVSIVLMTDGENNAGISAAEFLRHRRPGTVPTFAVGFGNARQPELARVAEATGGRFVDATPTSLLEAFKEIRGCS